MVANRRGECPLDRNASVLRDHLHSKRVALDKSLAEFDRKHYGTTMFEGPIFAEQKDEIRKKLTEVGAFLHPCPRCTNQNFVLLDGYIAIAIQSQLRGSFLWGQPLVPVVGVACTRCGFVIQHALGMLNLLPPEPATTDASEATGPACPTGPTGAVGPIISSGSLDRGRK